LEHMIGFYDPEQHGSLAFVFGADFGVYALGWASHILWALGYPDQAMKRSQEAIALAQELDHPFSLAFALSVTGVVPHIIMCREVQQVKKYTEALIRLSAEKGFAFYQALGMIYRGFLQTEKGQFEEAIAQMHQGLSFCEAIGTEAYRTFWLNFLAEAYGKEGKAEEGLRVMSEALAFVEKTGERMLEAELYRLKGELLLMQGEAEVKVEACFRKAIEIASRQSVKSWELRAVISLSRLLQKQGKKEEARKLLAEIYGWFTEGFDTTNLKEAKALLEELS